MKIDLPVFSDNIPILGLGAQIKAVWEISASLIYCNVANRRPLQTATTRDRLDRVKVNSRWNARRARSGGSSDARPRRRDESRARSLSVDPPGRLVDSPYAAELLFVSAVFFVRRAPS